MTILINQPDFGEFFFGSSINDLVLSVHVLTLFVDYIMILFFFFDDIEAGIEERHKVAIDENELKTSDGGFVAPHINSFGHNFRQKGVEEFYRTNHINQTVDFVRRMRQECGKMERVEMSIWECCELLNEYVDESDPDLDEPQIQHLLQTAEAIRKDYPDEDWLHLTALIHDLGKVLLHPAFGELPQWAMV
ncbi:hypothetical protein Goklo_008855, partial [Gossypium klotzschianum]|nr:hypothetical protein [Gossypium klotzschianum]